MSKIFLHHAFIVLKTENWFWSMSVLPFHFKFILCSVTKHINVRLYSVKHFDTIIPLGLFVYSWNVNNNPLERIHNGRMETK
jgi:hypothetical protein